MPFNQNYFVDNIISKSQKVKIIMNSVNTKKSQVSVIGLAPIVGKKKSQVECISWDPQDFS